MHGVIDVELPREKNICDLSYYKAGNLALNDSMVKKFYNTEGRKVTHKVRVYEHINVIKSFPSYILTYY